MAKDEMKDKISMTLILNFMMSLRGVRYQSSRSKYV